jgi:hypothetical protein
MQMHDTMYEKNDAAVLYVVILIYYVILIYVILIYYITPRGASRAAAGGPEGKWERLLPKQVG